MTDERPFDPGSSPEVAECLGGIVEAGLDTRIHPADEMYRFELEAPHRTPDVAAVRYFAAGRGIVRTIEELARWRFGGLGAVGSFLDFASGFGRTTRFLVRSLHPSRIAVAEIDPRAVRFQTEAFGVRGIVSGHDPADLRESGSHALVLAVSLFSHLPPGRFEAWLARLAALVAPGGMLVFSTHGERWIPEGAALPASGIGFSPRSETERLSGEEYGTTWVSPGFVRRAAGAADRNAALLFFEDGLCGSQDLYVLARLPLPAEPEPRLSRDPLGALEWAAVENGRVAVRGWAQGAADERPPDVRVFAGGELLAVSRGEGAAGARRAWRFDFPTRGIPPNRVVRVEAESARGVSRQLVTETLGPYLPRV